MRPLVEIVASVSFIGSLGHLQKNSYGKIGLDYDQRKRGFDLTPKAKQNSM
jgi:hypothetical protein